MYLGKLGFFKEKTTIEKQQLIKYLNLLKSNLKNNTLRFQICILKEELSLLNLFNASRQKAKKQRLSAKLKFTMRKRRAKKRFILKNNRVKSIELRQEILKITPQFPAFPELVINKNNTKKFKGYARIKLH
ncbi:hypothetical protein [Legionella drozanskii]|uniref:Uncharacterized protein n=1 Tax=Legionella drozanskii LLAP-1 TaxID=1212489 RepID=A0A0W0SR77_9GAMM|nr:hypothetical protein [Legionella drozanskii]KTC85835.1 hypothetical protein Ldro_2160 [Legionella drozanskii LLAP-1]